MVPIKKYLLIHRGSRMSLVDTIHHSSYNAAKNTEYNWHIKKCVCVCVCVCVCLCVCAGVCVCVCAGVCVHVQNPADCRWWACLWSSVSVRGHLKGWWCDAISVFGCYLPRDRDVVTQGIHQGPPLKTQFAAFLWGERNRWFDKPRKAASIIHINLD